MLWHTKWRFHNHFTICRSSIVALCTDALGSRGASARARDKASGSTGEIGPSNTHLGKTLDGPVQLL